MFIVRKNHLTSILLLIALSGASSLPVQANDASSPGSSDVTPVLNQDEVDQADKDACALTGGDTAGAIDCEVNRELEARKAAN